VEDVNRELETGFGNENILTVILRSGVFLHFWSQTQIDIRKMILEMILGTDPNLGLR